MIRTELMIPSLLVSACALLVASCESTTQVGSDCRNGVCPRENLISSEACVVSSTSAEIAVTRLREEPPGTPTLGRMCLPRPLPIDSQGQVACSVLWRLGEAFDSDEELPAEVAPPSPEQCSDLPFLEAAGPGHASSVCAVKQLTAEDVVEGELDGWFYDAEASECGRGTQPGPGVSFTLDATPRSGVVVQLNCSDVQAAESDGELVHVDATECGELANGSMDDVGDACLPAATPERGFDDRETYVETRSAQCETEACLVYRLRGHPGPDCQADRDAGVYCATEDELDKRAYCSCRCDAPAGDPGELCECGNGFSCIPVLEDGPPGIRGSYCVRNGTFTASD
jgi:hypothetical protein